MVLKNIRVNPDAERVVAECWVPGRVFTVAIQPDILEIPLDLLHGLSVSRMGRLIEMLWSLWLAASVNEEMPLEVRE
jgi:hypothetical protein